MRRSPPSQDHLLPAGLDHAPAPFARRHIGPDVAETEAMLRTLNLDSLEHLVRESLPEAIRTTRGMSIGAPRSEHELLHSLQQLADRNQVRRSCIGMGYYDTIVPAVIQRNVLENPAWYTQYTPYQSEISQGRLQALLNYQTMVSDLTGLPVANASLLDEATAAAEAMIMCRNLCRTDARTFVVSDRCHPQTLAVLRGRSAPLGITLRIESLGETPPTDFEDVFGVLIQYPDTDGCLHDWTPLVAAAHQAGAHVVMATDLLALTLIRCPGDFDVDIAIGSSQRFGVPMGYGGPHAAFLATAEGLRSKDARTHHWGLPRPAWTTCPADGDPNSGTTHQA